MVLLERWKIEFSFAVVTSHSCGFVSRENQVRKSWSELRLCRWLPICLAALFPMRIQSAITVKRRSKKIFFTDLWVNISWTNPDLPIFEHGLSFSHVLVNFEVCFLTRTPPVFTWQASASQCTAMAMANGESFTIVANRAVRYTFMIFYAETN